MAARDGEIRRDGVREIERERETVERLGESRVRRLVTSVWYLHVQRSFNKNFLDYVKNEIEISVHCALMCKAAVFCDVCVLTLCSVTVCRIVCSGVLEIGMT